MPKRIKQKPNKKVILIDKHPAFGGVPLYVGLGHRHLEKEMPEAGYNASITADKKVREKGTYMVPVDLAAMVLPAEYAAQVESIELTYEREL